MLFLLIPIYFLVSIKIDNNLWHVEQPFEIIADVSADSIVNKINSVSSTVVNKGFSDDLPWS